MQDLVKQFTRSAVASATSHLARAEQKNADILFPIARFQLLDSDGRSDRAHSKPGFEKLESASSKRPFLGR
jgi:hypothetical protein